MQFPNYAMNNSQAILSKLTPFRQSEGVPKSDSFSNDSNDSWDFGEYLNGLMASTGEIIDRNQEFNAEQAAAARDWQVQYMKDYYPNMVESLKKSGLNPILAAGVHSAASVPSAASASSNNVGGDTLGSILAVFGNTISDILGAVLSSKATVASSVIRSLF